MCEHVQHAFPCDLLTCTGQGNTLRLLVTGERNSMGDMLTVGQWTSIARHGDPAACRILDGMRRGMDDALACGRLRGMCTPA